MHVKYSKSRLEGEWFNITEDQVQTEIDFYSSREFVNRKNQFQIAWSKSVSDYEPEQYELQIFLAKITIELYDAICSLDLDKWIMSNDFYDSYILNAKRYSGKTKTFVTQSIKKYAEFNELKYQELKSNGVKKFKLSKKL